MTQGVIDIGHCSNSAIDVDFFTRLSFWIPGSVPFFVMIPRNNVVRNFVTFQSRRGSLLTGKSWWDNPVLITPSVTATNENQVTGMLTTRDASMFENAFANDFRPRAGTPAAELGFNPVAPNEAGRTDSTATMRSTARFGW